MAKIFGGFTPEQMGKIVPEMAGMQADEQAAYLASQPGAAARVGKMAEVAQKRIGMAYGGMATKKGYAVGGFTDVNDPLQDLGVAKTGVTTANKALQDALAAQKANPSDAALVEGVTNAQTELDASGARLAQAQSMYKTVGIPSATEIKGTAAADPSKLLTKAETAKVSDEDKTAGEIDTTTGKLTGDANTAALTKAGIATEAKAPDAKEAAVYTPVEANAGVDAVLERLTAATGKPSESALADAAQMSPEVLSSLGLSVAQIEEARKIIAPSARTLQDGEMIEGSTVDMERVKKEVNFEAATGAPSTDATVQGQLTGLMEQFEGSEPPAWAAGAMRNAAAQMAARGLSASSMAGQSMIQAAMESALPIAQIDSATFARFEEQNLSNRQQSAMFAAERRAEFLGLEFNQDFQSRVSNAARISDIANMNFTADQQIALENAKMAQTVDLANLNPANAKIMADAAALNSVDITNLNNRQSSAVQNAQSFLQMDMSSLANEQQTSVFKAQQLANTLLSDTAAANAAKQFNATSENQTEQFFSSLAANVALHNNEQLNGMNRFNAGEANSIDQFNATAREARNQFNSTNALVMAQANAAWSQATTTAATAAQNQNNRDAAMSSNEFTMAAYNAIVQEERDLVSFVFNAAQKQMDRDTSITLQSMQNESQKLSDQASIDVAGGQGFGQIAAAIAPSILKGIFGGGWA